MWLNLVFNIFCRVSEPKLQETDFIFTDIDNDLFLDINDTANFDNGSVIAYSYTDGGQLRQVSFTRGSFPVNVTELPADRSVSLEATFTVGTERDCRGNDGGIVTSQVLSVIYQGKSFSRNQQNSHPCPEIVVPKRTKSWVCLILNVKIVGMFAI